MIFVDTSVWVDYFRVEHTTLADELNRLLDQDRVALAVPVRIELLSGVSARRLPQFRRLLSALPVFFPSEQVWLTMERWVEVSSARGARFGVSDLLIAAIAAENDGEIWSLDEDFARLARLGFVRRHSR
jgi:predicted nucleic acid-binding protein